MSKDKEKDLDKKLDKKIDKKVDSELDLNNKNYTKSVKNVKNDKEDLTKKSEKRAKEDDGEKVTVKRKISLSELTGEDNSKEKTSTKKAASSNIVSFGPKSSRDKKSTSNVVEENSKKKEKDALGDSDDETIESSKKTSKREKIKLDELIKKTTKEEKAKTKKEDVIINLDFKGKDKDKSKDKKDKKNKSKNDDVKVDKKKLARDVKELGTARDDDDENNKKSKLKEKNKNKHYKEDDDKDVKGEINLDVLGVTRAKEERNILPSIIKVSFIVIMVIGVLLALAALPIFNVNEVNISGLSMVERNKILDVAGYNKTKNFFFLYLNNVEGKIKDIPQVKNASVRFSFPNEINIKINEIRIAGYIPYVTEYVYIDSDGKVVNISDKKIEGIPLIEGLDFSHFVLGNVLETSNKQSLKTIIEITNVLNKYDISSLISEVNVTNPDDVTLLVGQIEVNIGTIEECDHKIRVAMEAIEKLADGVKGYLNVSSSSGKIYFRPVA